MFDTGYFVLGFGLFISLFISLVILFQSVRSLLPPLRHHEVAPQVNRQLNAVLLLSVLQIINALFYKLYVFYLADCQTPNEASEITFTSSLRV